jgi:hypothetical protein
VTTFVAIRLTVFGATKIDDLMRRPEVARDGKNIARGVRRVERRTLLRSARFVTLAGTISRRPGV